VLAANLALFVALSIVMPAAVGYFGGAPRWGVFETLRRFDVLATAVLLPLACSFLCFFGQGVRETQKIAGPSYRFRAVFRELAALRIPRGVKIRKGDYLQSTASELNGSLERLHDEVAALRRIALRAARAGPRLADAATPCGGSTPHAAPAPSRVLADAPAALIASVAPVAPVTEPVEAEAVGN
jgi:hypothetical protein